VSPLSGDDVEMLRECASLLGERQAAKLRALADKLEAEPEPGDEQWTLTRVEDHGGRARSAWQIGTPGTWSENHFVRYVTVVPADNVAAVERERDEARESAAAARSLMREIAREATERGEALEALVDAFTRDIGKVLAPLMSKQRATIVGELAATYAALSRAEEVMRPDRTCCDTEHGDPHERQCPEFEPSDDDIYNGPGMEGGIAYGPDLTGGVER
jgi:hypothetical protein